MHRQIGESNHKLTCGFGCALPNPGLTAFCPIKLVAYVFHFNHALASSLAKKLAKIRIFSTRKPDQVLRSVTTIGAEV